MTTPERPTPAEILEMVDEYVGAVEQALCAYESGTGGPARMKEARAMRGPIAAALALYDWRPIADAPKDGTEVLARNRFGNVDLLSWEPVIGWTGRDCEPTVVGPTHFQLIPAPPKEG